MSLQIAVREARIECQSIIDLVGSDHCGIRRLVVLPLSVRFAEQAAERQAVGREQRIGGLQIDRAAEAAFGERRIGILDDVDAAHQFARDGLQRTVLRVAAGAAAGGFAGHVELLSRQKHIAVQRREVLPQPVDEY